MTRVPWFKFFWGDWHGDANLQSCGAAARGVWIELLGLMKHNAVWRLENNPAVLSRLTGLTPKSIASGISELSRRGVLEFDSDGYIFCRRICNERKLSELRKEVGKKGGEKTKILLRQNKLQNTHQNSGSGSGYDSDSISSTSLTERGYRGETQTESSDCAALGSPQPPSGLVGEVVTEKHVAAPPRVEPAPDATLTRPDTRNARGEALREFEAWYCKLYPRHQGREDAEKAWIQVTVSAPAHKRASAEEIMEGTRQQIAAGSFNRDPKYIPLPATYLRGYRFRDEVSTGATQPVFNVPFASSAPVEMPTDPIWLDLLGLPANATKADVREAQLALERGEMQ